MMDHFPKPLTTTDKVAEATWAISSDLIGVTNAEGKFSNTNPAWYETLGYLPEEIESIMFFDLVHPEDIETTQKAFTDLKADQALFGFKNRYQHKDGSYRWLSWNAIPINDLFHCTGRDVTNDVEAKIQLRTFAEETKLREQFIAILGHDVRNPLASIDSAVRIMRREEQSEKTQRMLDGIEGSVGRIVRLIDDVNDFTRTRLGGGLVLELRSNIPLVPAIKAAIEEIRLSSPEADIRQDFSLDATVECDVRRIQQLVSNLLANAVTHGDIGEPIHVRTYDEKGRFKIAVCNSGAPIPDSARLKLFKPFFREEHSQSKNGLGLGLYIASEIAKAHNGTLTVSSDVEQTVFELSMPL